MDANLLSAFLGAVLSLFFGWTPGVKDWYGNLPTTVKRAVMGVAMILVTYAIIITNCFGLGSVVVCDPIELGSFLRLLFMSLFANQTTYMLLVRKSGPDTDKAVPVQPVPEKG